MLAYCEFSLNYHHSPGRVFCGLYDLKQEQNEDDEEDQADAAAAVVADTGTHAIAAKAEHQDQDEQKNKHCFSVRRRFARWRCDADLLISVIKQIISVGCLGCEAFCWRLKGVPPLPPIPLLSYLLSMVCIFVPLQNIDNRWLTGKIFFLKGLWAGAGFSSTFLLFPLFNRIAGWRG
jgi:hypothetical protein